MTPSTAVNQIKRIYPDLTDIQIENYNEGFKQFSPSDIEKLIEYFKDTYDYQNPPKWAFFSKAGYKIGIGKNQKKIIAWYKCSNCSIEYSIKGKGCPKCYSSKATIVTGESFPEDLIDMQEDCFYCSIFKESQKKGNARRMYGNSCNDYGVKQTPNSPCKACQCSECCIQMIEYNRDPRGTVDKYKTTEFAQPWIKETEPLKTTVTHMIKHIAKTKNADR
jgi:hypothetical protein